MYTLHFVPDWASLAVRLTLEEFQIPYVASLAEQRDTPEFRKMSPLGLIPAFSTPVGDMCETVAILLWLSDQHPGVAPAAKSPDRAAYLRWLLFINNSIHSHILSLFHPERVSSSDSTDATMQNARNQVQQALSIVNAMVTQDQPSWFQHETPSAICYYLGLLMRWMNGFDATHPAHIPSTNYPALHSMLKGLENRRASRACAELEGLGDTIFTHPTLL
ncbi:glutathione S-transferase family protein [Pseudomonas sp. LFS044]|uniref:glutathione S-transferase family protein n=1 Tax=Pseudomonas sp. LFS044 TaxID=3229880 RepID=UPI003A811D87